MVQSNEFKGASLAEAVRNATAVYGKSWKRMGRDDICFDLSRELSDFKREAARAEDRAEALRREAERLADEARRDAKSALVETALAAAGYFGSAAKAWRRMRSVKNLGDLKWTDYLRLVPVLGAAYAAASDALDAVRNSNAARRLARQASTEEREADRLGDEIVRIAEASRRAGCGSRRNTS